MQNKLMCVGEALSANKESVQHRRSIGKAEEAALVIQIKKCGNKRDLQQGKLLHTRAIEAGCHNNRYIARTLITMYRKCGSMQGAQSVYKSMLEHDVVSWTAIILGYVENGENLMALEVFARMDCVPNSFTFVAALKACANMASDKKTRLEKGKAIHKLATEHGFSKHIFVANTLVGMYSKCGSMGDARKCFNNMIHRDVVSWNSLLLGYVENGESLKALELLTIMEFAPDHITFLAALKACAALASNNQLERSFIIQKVMAIHRQAREDGYEKHVYVANTLVDIYSKCGHMRDARYVFENMIHHDVVSWTALILGYVENGESFLALDLFINMDCARDTFTYVAALKACAGLATANQSDKKTSLECGMYIHRELRERGFEKDVLAASTLVDMYSKAGSMRDACAVFDNMTHRTVVSWTALILGYVENGESSSALELFTSMDCAPNHVTFVAALKACASLSALETGRRIHKRIRELGLESDEMAGTCLVDLYGKCGDMAAAEEVFKNMHSPNVVSWTALIGGYSLLGNAPQVFKLVKKMQEDSLQMNDVTMLLILRGCTHAGMVEEGQMYFDSMSRYGIRASVEHYTCMVDMLGRANRLQEALSLITNMQLEGDSVMWMSLLGACKKWSNLEVAKVAFRALVSKNTAKDEVAAACVLMRSIYRRLGMNPEEEQI